MNPTAQTTALHPGPGVPRAIVAHQGETTAPRLHPGRAPRFDAHPAATTHPTSPAHAAGLLHTARCAPDCCDTAPARRGHHRRASRRTAQSIGRATVEYVVLRHRMGRDGSRTLLSPHRRMRARLQRRAAVGRPPPHEDARVVRAVIRPSGAIGRADLVGGSRQTGGHDRVAWREGSRMTTAWSLTRLSGS
jgi:hypothetical protein